VTLSSPPSSPTQIQTLDCGCVIEWHDLEVTITMCELHSGEDKAEND
jgi:hypothetical protein